MNYAELKEKILSIIVEDKFRFDPDTFGLDGATQFLQPFLSKPQLEIQSTVQKFLDSEKRIIVDGETSFSKLGIQTLHVSTEFFIADEDLHCTLSFILPGEWKPDIIEKPLKPLFKIFNCSYSLRDNCIILSTYDKAIVPRKIQELHRITSVPQGASIVSTFEIKGPIIDIFDQLFKSLQPLDLTAALSKRWNPSQMVAFARIGPIPLGVIVLKDIHLNFNPKVQTIALENTISIEANDDTIEFEGGGKSKANSEISLHYRLKGVRKKNETSSGRNYWENPFGVQGIIVRELGAGFGMESEGPTVSVMGIITIGEGGADPIRLKAGGQFVNGVPSALVCSVESEEKEDIALSKFVASITRFPAAGFPLLNEIKLKRVGFYVVFNPEGFISPIDSNEVYHGVGMHAETTVFGISSLVHFEFKYDKGLKAHGELGIIELGNVLRITDASGTKGPFLSIDTTQMDEANGNREILRLSCKVELFNFISQSLDARILQNGFEFILGMDLGSISHFQLACFLSYDNQFRGSAKLQFEFDDKSIDIWVFGQKVCSITLGLNAKGSLTISHSQNQTGGSVSISVSLSGLPQLQFTFAFGDIRNLAEEVFQEINRRARSFYEESFRDPKKLLRFTMGTDIQFHDLGRTLKDVYKQGVREAADLLIDNGFNFEFTAGILRNSYGLTPDAVFDMLDPLLQGSSIFEYVCGLMALDWDGKRIANKLKAMGKAVNDVTDALIHIVRLDTQAIANSLKDAFPDVNAVVSALTEKLRVRFWDMAGILKNAGYPLRDIAVGLRNSVIFETFGIRNIAPESLKLLQSHLVAKHLKILEYDINDVSEGLTAAFTHTREFVSNVLHRVGFSPGEIASMSRIKWNWNAEKIGEVLSKELRLPDNIVRNALISADFSGHEIDKVAEQLKRWRHELEGIPPIRWPNPRDWFPI